MSYLITHTPTIAEVRRIGRDTLATWPLPMLLALIAAGVDVEREAEATIEQYVHEGSLVELRWRCRHRGKVIAILGGEGVSGFRALARRPKEPAPATQGRLCE